MKAFFILLLISFQFSIKAQQNIPNASFENWHSIPNSFGGEDPDSWRSNNAATAGSNRKGVAKSTDAYMGSYALELTPLISIDSNTYLTTQICTGNPDLDYGTYTLDIETGGYFFNELKPGSLYGYYKYTPSANADDSVYAIVYLKKI